MGNSRGSALILVLGATIVLLGMALLHSALRQENSDHVPDLPLPLPAGHMLAPSPLSAGFPLT